MDRRPNRHERILRRRANMEHIRRLRLQLHEREYEGSSNSSETSYNSNVEEEILGLEESDEDVDMQKQEQFEQEQIEDGSWSEDDIPSDNNNTDWSTDDTQDSVANIIESGSDEFDEDIYLRMALRFYFFHKTWQQSTARD